MEESKFFHSKDKGCDLIVRPVFAYHTPSKGPTYVAGGYCKTHEADICKCGWEYGWHYETDSRSLKYYERKKLDRKSKKKLQ